MKKRLLVISRNRLQPDFWFQYVDKHTTDVQVCSEFIGLQAANSTLSPTIIVIDDYFNRGLSENWMNVMLESLISNGHQAQIICLSPRFASGKRIHHACYSGIECYCFEQRFVLKLALLTSANQIELRA